MWLMQTPLIPLRFRLTPTTLTTTTKFSRPSSRRWMQRLWVDDIRPMPEGFDLWAKTANEAVALLLMNTVGFVSFDHDLGGSTGYEVAKWVEQAAFEGLIGPFEWEVHSSNPVGRQNIEAALRKAEQYWSRQVL